MRYLDLIQYIKVRERCSTRMARRVILAGCIRIDGKVVGLDFDENGQLGLSPWIPADLKDKIEIVEPSDEHLGD